MGRQRIHGEGETKSKVLNEEHSKNVMRIQAGRVVMMTDKEVGVRRAGK